MRRFMLATALALGLAGLALAADAPTADAPKSDAKKEIKDRAMSQIDTIIQNAKVDKSNPSWRVSLSKPEIATFDPKHSYFARMSTNKGPILIKFMPDVAPMHVTSFVYLTKLGFYDGAIDGRIGPVSQEAYARFQAASGEVADGFITLQSYEELAAATR